MSVMIDSSRYRITYVNHKNTRMHGSVEIDEDGFATIYLNARRSHDQQRRTFDHELRHILNDDAYNELSIVEAERIADGMPKAAPAPVIELLASREADFLRGELSMLARMRAWLWWRITPSHPVWRDLSRSYRTELIHRRGIGLDYANRKLRPNPPHISGLVRKLWRESF